MATAIRILQSIDNLDTAWLAAALGRPGLEVTGTEEIGHGQMSQNHRVRFTDAGGTDGSVVVKLASADAQSRATGIGLGAYHREVTFYRQLAGRVGSAVPDCHLAEYDAAEGWFTLVLEDVAGGVQRDQIAGCTLAEAEVAVRELARLHAPVMNDLALGTEPFLNLPDPLDQALFNAVLPGFLERYAGRVAPEHVEVLQRFAPVVDAWKADRLPPLGLVHGDFRLDNLLFTPDGGCKVVDWQTVSWGPALTDLAYLIGGSLAVPAERRESERALVAAYQAELVAAGCTALDPDEAWEGYRRAAFYGIVMAVVASMIVERTDRGDDMFMGSLARHAQQIIDVGALDLLPAADAAPPVPLRPDPKDEGLHEPGAEPLWNESWYLDAVSDDGTLGVYTRVGRLPNQDCCMYTVCVTGPGRPSIMRSGMFPLPAADDPRQTVDHDGVHSEYHCEEALERFRVVITADAGAHEDHSGPLRAEPGTPVQIAMDLTWETVGVPYQWRQATRYEIPCRVTGTVTVDGEEVAFAGPGQRDHSWGSRDWWAVDWMWNGLHLDDGTHVHQVAVPQLPGHGVGYVQRDGDLVEVTGATLETTVDERGLPTHARITAEPMGLTLDVEPLAFGAIRADAPDGRISRFPRAMARFTTDDGRTGSGWIEWNMVERPDA